MLIVINILLSFPLIMIVNLIVNNTITDNKITIHYVSAVLFVVCELYLEIISLLILDSQGEVAVFFNKLVNGIGFAVSPFITYNLMMMQSAGKDKKWKIMMSIPLFINAMICMISIMTGWVFCVWTDNSYHRGEWFFLPLIICLLYLIGFFLCIVSKNSQSNYNDKVQFTIINMSVLFGILIQLIYANTILIWSTASVALILYYMILREQQFRYDDLTKVESRFRYTKQIGDMVGKACTLVIVDLNDFKEINDTYGHIKGDEVLFNAANLLQQNFKNLGNVFRIGGDEFCVICNKIYDKSDIDKKFESMHMITQKHVNDYVGSKLFSYGVADYIPDLKNKTLDLKNNLQEIIKLADKAMYDCKNSLKE